MEYSTIFQPLAAAGALMAIALAIAWVARGERPEAPPAEEVRVDQVDRPAGTAEDFRREAVQLPDGSEELEGFLDRWRGRLPAPPPSPLTSSPATSTEPVDELPPRIQSKLERIALKLEDLVVPTVTAAASFLGGPGAGAAIAAAMSAAPPRPLRLPIPQHEPGSHVRLELDTNADVEGGPFNLLIVTDRRAYEHTAWIPASAVQVNVVDLHGHEPIRHVVIPELKGLDKIRVLINGFIAIEGRPEVLRALQ